MMPRDQIGEKAAGGTVFLQGQSGAGSGMGRRYSGCVIFGVIETVAAAEIGLKGVGGLAEVVKETGKTGPFGRVEGCSEFGGEFGDAFEMLV